MKIVKIYKPPSQRLKKIIAEKRGWDLKNSKGFERLKEDYFGQSRKFPIFAVADGVTLVIKPGHPYPSPTGAGKIAKIFCKNAISQAEKIYNNFQKESILDVFTKANIEAGKYNTRRGLTKKTINYFDKDYFCAAAAFAAVKKSELFWGVIGDSGIMLTDKLGKIKLLSQNRVERIEKMVAKKFPHPKPQEKKYFQQKYYRNKIGKDGELIGYGIINGEENALKYVESGKTKIRRGDRLYIFTDGFTPYFELPEFNKLFLKWPSNLESRISEFTRNYVTENSSQDSEKQYRFLYKYASEKSLFAKKF